MTSSALRTGPPDRVGPPLWREPQLGDGSSLAIGLVNNMPDAALASTERQFRGLLSDASPGLAVELKLLSLREVPRGAAGRLHVFQHYEDVREYFGDHLDGLIVTGTEPRARALADEPYWLALTELVDWADVHTTSTIWSCLAAQAAVLHLDGIERRALGRKLSGLFECTKVAEHATLAGTPARWCIPHSRHNDIPEECLAPRGYTVLSRSPEGGADMFLRQGRSMFLFLQGHPEYDPWTLLCEYRRDVERFLTGESNRYPDMPCGYFDGRAAAALEEFRRRALEVRSVDLLPSFPVSTAGHEPRHTWRGVATRIFANWLSYLADAKARSVCAWPSAAP